MSVKLKENQKDSDADCFVILSESGGDEVDLDVYDEDGDIISTLGRITNDGCLELYLISSDERTKLTKRGLKFEEGYLKVKKD